MAMNDSDFLAIAVATLGTAIRSLDRMQRYDLTIPMQENLIKLQKELKGLREEERSGRKTYKS